MKKYMKINNKSAERKYCALKTTDYEMYSEAYL